MGSDCVWGGQVVYRLQCFHKAGNNRRIALSLEITNRCCVTFEMIRSLVRVLVVLHLKQQEDTELEPARRGWMSYDELIRRLEKSTDWSVDRTALIQMLSKIVRKVRSAGESLGQDVGEILERWDGAVRLNPMFAVKVDDALMRSILGNGLTQEPLIPLPDPIDLVMAQYNLPPVARAMIWQEFLDIVSQQLSNQKGAVYELVMNWIRRMASGPGDWPPSTSAGPEMLGF